MYPDCENRNHTMEYRYISEPYGYQNQRSLISVGKVNSVFVPHVGSICQFVSSVSPGEGGEGGIVTPRIDRNPQKHFQHFFSFWDFPWCTYHKGYAVYFSGN